MRTWTRRAKNRCLHTLMLTQPSSSWQAKVALAPLFTGFSRWWEWKLNHVLTPIALITTLEFPANEIVKFLVGFTNKGSQDFTVKSLEASFRYPQDFQFYIQNVSSICWLLNSLSITLAAFMSTNLSSIPVSYKKIHIRSIEIARRCEWCVRRSGKPSVFRWMITSFCV